jgi:predicted RNase H-like HicB family nuclease
MMHYRLGVEDIEPNHYVAYTLDLPGCFSSARTEADAVARAPDCIGAYYDWLMLHDPSLPTVRGPFAVTVVEVFHSFTSYDDPNYLVNACFANDRRPLTYWDVVNGLRLLEWSRHDLLQVIQSIPHDQLHRIIPGERRVSFAGILRHIAVTENWYLSRLGVALEHDRYIDDPHAMLDTVRIHARKQLVSLVGDDRVRRHQGESWTARKVLRRMLWHERDHTQHIAKLVGSELRVRG